MTAYKNPEWDLALDYYFTVKNGMSIEEAERVFQEFERKHYAGWDLRLFIREYIFLYICAVRAAEAAGFAISGGEDCRASRRRWQGRCNVMIMSSDLIQIDGLAPIKNGARKTSKVMLLFPPEWVPTAPYLALPSLTAVLREAGHTRRSSATSTSKCTTTSSATEFLIWVRARQGMQLKALQDEREAGRADGPGSGPESRAGAGR